MMVGCNTASPRLGARHPTYPLELTPDGNELAAKGYGKEICHEKPMPIEDNVETFAREAAERIVDDLVLHRGSPNAQ